MTGKRRTAIGAVSALLTLVPGLAAGCSSGLPRAAAGAPVLRVVTGAWPLAQAAAAIGGAKAAVGDVVPTGSDPLSFRPDPGGVKELQDAGLVLLGGASLQPALDSAAQGSRRVLRLADALKTSDPYVWLDPATMQRAVQAMADAMSAANPPAAPLYERNAAGLRSEIGSLDIDFSSTLSTCRATTIVTPDGALAAMAAQYGLTDLIAPPTLSASAAGNLQSRLRASTGSAVLSEPWVDNDGVRQVAAGTGTRIHSIDTLTGTPDGGTRGQDTYTSRMEQLLGALSGALGCDSGTQ